MSLEGRHFFCPFPTLNSPPTTPHFPPIFRITASNPVLRSFTLLSNLARLSSPSWCQAGGGVEKLRRRIICTEVSLRPSVFPASRQFFLSFLAGRCVSGFIRFRHGGQV